MIITVPLVLSVTLPLIVALIAVAIDAGVTSIMQLSAQLLFLLQQRLLLITVRSNNTSVITTTIQQQLPLPQESSPVPEALE